VSRIEQSCATDTTQDYLQIAYGESGDLQRALALAGSTLTLATKLGNSAEVREAHGGLGFLLWCGGDFESARQHLEQAAAMAARLPEAQAEPLGSVIQAFPCAHALGAGYPDSARLSARCIGGAGATPVRLTA
jgi:hypothetical protein